MKKDEQLEREFDAYFDGVMPTDNATDEAKKLIAKKARTKKNVRRFIPAFASVAAAAGIAVLVINVALPKNRPNDGSSYAPGTSDTDPSNDGTPVFNFYSDNVLTVSSLSAYSRELPKGLDFVKTLEFAPNAAVNDFCAYSYSDGTLALVRADISALVNGYRHDTTVYVEYTPKKEIYEPLKVFYDLNSEPDGATHLFKTENNGETVYNVLAYKNGVRYYISVESADEIAYKYYLSII